MDESELVHHLERSILDALRLIVADNRLLDGLGGRGWGKRERLGGSWYRNTNGVPTAVAVLAVQYPAGFAATMYPSCVFRVCLRCPGHTARPLQHPVVSSFSSSFS